MIGHGGSARTPAGARAAVTRTLDAACMLSPRVEVPSRDGAGGRESGASRMKRGVGAGVVAVVAATHLVLLLHTPIALFANASHDDTLFMRLAMHVASGEWLGPFSQYTLMKGPGYPLFVALSSAIGIPLSLGHALFQLAAVGVAALAVARLGGGAGLGILAFVVLLLHPAGLSRDLVRVIRDQIYWGQSLLVAASLALGYFGAREARRGAGWCAAAGLVLAWAWYTREESVWFLPGAAVLAAGAALVEWAAARSVRRAALKTLFVAAGFASLQLALSTANWLAYGTFTAVDFKEGRFVAALNALQGVRSGDQVPYVPVSKATRQAVYEVSPSFASMRAYFDPPPPGQTPWQYGCKRRPETCGEIAGGWWIWALRDAAARRGHYDSPRAAREFFGAIADEVERACDSGRLSCRRAALDYLPRMTAEQWRSLPERALQSFRQLLLVETPSLRYWPSAGSASDVETFWRFLNHPRIAPSRDAAERRVVQGWLYRPGAPWPTFEVLDAWGAPAPFELERAPSQDVAQLFGDERARYQRFVVTTGCMDRCSLVVRGAEEMARYALGAGRTGLVDVRDPALDLYVERDERQAAAASGARSFAALRAALVRIYRVAVPAIVLGGLLALGAAVRRGARLASSPPLVAVVALWALVLTRVALVVLVDASSFPALTFQYLAPGCYLAVAAAFFSFAAVRRVGTEPRRAGLARAPAAGAG